MRRFLFSIACASLGLSCWAARGEELLDDTATPSEQTSIADVCGCPCDGPDSLPECCDCFNDGKRLGGLFLPSDHCFDSFISPLSNPFFFEDPRQLTEARGIFLDNNLPATVGGGDAQVWAGQLRGRLADRWSVISPRLGYFQVNQGGGGAPVGFLSAPVGAKYTFLRDVERQLLVSGGITYFIPGAASAFANFGGGDFHFFLTGGKEILGQGHWLSGTGFRIPTDNNFGTQMWYWSNQWDYELPNHLYPLFGINWYHWMRNSNNNFTNGISGLDLINLPTNNVAGTNAVTGVVGLKWKPSGHLEVGGGYEFRISQVADILANRVYADIIFRY